MKPTLRRKIQQFTATVIAAVMLVSITVIPVQAIDTQRRFTDTEIDRWIATTSAILNYHNTGIPNLFAQNLRPNIRTQERERSHNILTGRQWNIHSQEDLFMHINSLLVWGHNGSFWDTIYDAAPIMLEIMDDPRVLDEIMWLVSIGELDRGNVYHVLDTWDTMLYWGEAGIIAWDMFRVGSLIVWGYLSGLITRAEAREQMVPAIHILLHYFDSWEDAIVNYLDGMAYWRGAWDTEVIRRYEEATRLIQMDPVVFDNRMFE